ncbi:MAG: hypothetical protein RL607_2257 [Bacteroidota bacterium]|jgi:hypothetical protein
MKMTNLRIEIIEIVCECVSNIQENKEFRKQPVL